MSYIKVHDARHPLAAQIGPEIERCRSNIENPPSPDWTGATAMTAK